MNHAHAEANLRCAWSLLDALAARGVFRVFIAPGSRSTPLTLCALHHPALECVVHFDERGLGFAALGYGRATRQPALVITTSGTAVANLLPAVVEASQDDVPMIILSADRPPSYRGSGANQTIDQIRIFGTAPRLFEQLPTPPWSDEHLDAGEYAEMALFHARLGPVHFNMPFEEPLVPTPDTVARCWQDLPVSPKISPSSPIFTSTPAPETTDAVAMLASHERMLMVAGRLDTNAERDAVLHAARLCGAPLLVDATSGLMGHPEVLPASIDHLADLSITRELPRPTSLVEWGGRVVSKQWLSYAKGIAPEYRVRVSPSAGRLDPDHSRPRRCHEELPDFVRALEQRPACVSPEFRSAWYLSAATIAGKISSLMDDSEEWSEPVCTRHLTRALSGVHSFYVAASLPIRMVDLFGFAVPQGIPLFSNRGASGIDGTIASAAGAVMATRKPGVLLIGDLALLHDLNSLALVSRLALPLTIVVFNNDGGGIFSMLPIAEHRDTFERAWGTPHGFQFASAAQQFGLTYHAPQSHASMEQALRSAIASAAPSLIELHFDRAHTASRLRSIRAALTARET